jgi:hypothetical protein
MPKPLREAAKKFTETLTGWRQPAKSDLDELVRERKAHTRRFKDDGLTPNHPRWPLVLYRSPVALTHDFDPAAVFEDLFERNGWGDSWRAGIYDFLHYHSRIHEVLGIARGRVRVRFGGARDEPLSLKPATLPFSLPARGINAWARLTCLSSGLIQRPARTTNAGLIFRIMTAP